MTLSPPAPVATGPVPPRWRTYLRLGRVSNLPTVWTNVLAGMVLGAAPLSASAFGVVAVCASGAYVSGMLLNDAFDRDIDARERPERPIPSGHISSTEVFVVGFGLLALCVAALGLAGWAIAPGTAAASLLAGAILAGCVVLYDVWHKENPASPLVMGACRASVYAAGALAAGGHVGADLWLGCGSILLYVTGLTFVARQENRNSFAGYALLGLLGAPLLGAFFVVPLSGAFVVAALLFSGWVVAAVSPLFVRTNPNVPRAVVRMIAGISLVDGLFIVGLGPSLWILVGPGGVVATLLFQRYVRGT